MFESLLVVAPHPDDDILGCGGLIHKMAAQHKKVIVAFMNGESLSRYGEALIALHDVADQTYAFVFSEFERAALKDAVVFLEDIIDVHRPHAVAIPNPQAYHQDHRFSAEAAIIATRPSGGTGRYRPPVVIEYEMAGDAWPARTHTVPQLTVELEPQDVLFKRDAMLMHKSQVRPCPSERSVDTISALAELRGSQAGVKYGEAYTVHRYLI